MSDTQYSYPTYLQLRPPTSSYFGGPREPVPDWFYMATLWPSAKLSFSDGDRVNFEASIAAPIGDPPPGFEGGSAYGHLNCSPPYGWIGLRPKHWGRIGTMSALTGFLKTFDLYKPPMSTAKRVRVAKEFIATGPLVVVSTIWVAYSRKQQRTVQKDMFSFPRRPDGTYDPHARTEDGELLRAMAHVSGYWTIHSFRNYHRSIPGHQLTEADVDACYNKIVKPDLNGND